MKNTLSLKQLISEQWQYKGTLRQDGDQSLFTKQNVNDIAKDIQKQIKTEFVSCKPDPSYGKYRSHINIYISLDKKSQWENSLYVNSRHSRFTLYSDGQLVQEIKDPLIRQKFRRSRVTSISDAIKKINKYIEIIQ